MKENVNQLFFNDKNITILIAEDDEINFFLLSEMLADCSLNILHANDGLEAVEMFKTNSNEIELILMDLKMPAMSGFEATRAIRALDPKIPIIAQTAYAMLSEKEMVLREGFTDYLSKPLDRDQLINLMVHYLKKNKESGN